MTDRLLFAKAGQQQEFLHRATEKLGWSWGDLAANINLHPRTVRDWVREKYAMPHSVALSLSQQAAIPLPSKVRVKVWRDHMVRTSRLGNEALKKKYGGPLRSLVNESYRQQRWQEWWEREGRKKFHPIINRPFPVRKPRPSALLAEFVGIVLGDGSISPMQIVITHHRYDDREYGAFIQECIKKLFRVEPGMHESKKFLATDICISRRELVKYFVNKLKLKIGNKVKQQVDIPDWIKSNQRYLQSCVRGLVDTDGSVFMHRYQVNGKWYSYKKLSFSNHSLPLLAAVHKYLTSIGLRPRLVGKREVRLDSQADIQKYARVVGFHNPKHLRRYSD